MTHESKAIAGYCEWRIRLTDTELKESRKHGSLPSSDRVVVSGNRFDGWALSCANYGASCPICRYCDHHCVGHIGLMPHVDPSIPVPQIAIANGLENTRLRLKDSGWELPMTAKAVCPDGHVGCVPHTPGQEEIAA